MTSWMQRFVGQHPEAYEEGLRTMRDSAQELAEAGRRADNRDHRRKIRRAAGELIRVVKEAATGRIQP